MDNKLKLRIGEIMKLEFREKMKKKKSNLILFLSYSIVNIV